MLDSCKSLHSFVQQLLGRPYYCRSFIFRSYIFPQKNMTQNWKFCLTEPTCRILPQIFGWKNIWSDIEQPLVMQSNSSITGHLFSDHIHNFTKHFFTNSQMTLQIGRILLQTFLWNNIWSENEWPVLMQCGSYFFRPIPWEGLSTTTINVP